MYLVFKILFLFNFVVVCMCDSCCICFEKLNFCGAVLWSNQWSLTKWSVQNDVKLCEIYCYFLLSQRKISFIPKIKSKRSWIEVWLSGYYCCDVQRNIIVQTLIFFYFFIFFLFNCSQNSDMALHLQNLRYKKNKLTVN